MKRSFLLGLLVLSFTGLYSLDVDARVTSRPGKRKAPKAGASTNHKGTDYSMPCKSKVTAKKGGVVKITEKRPGYGYTIAIETSKNCRAIYAHLTKGSYKVRPGQKVSAGQLIGLSGNSGVSTGCHLHYENCSNLYSEDETFELPEELRSNEDTIQSAGLFDILRTERQ